MNRIIEWLLETNEWPRYLEILVLIALIILAYQIYSFIEFKKKNQEEQDRV